MITILNFLINLERKSIKSTSSRGPDTGLEAVSRQERGNKSCCLFSLGCSRWRASTEDKQQGKNEILPQDVEGTEVPCTCLSLCRMQVHHSGYKNWVEGYKRLGGTAQGSQLGSEGKPLPRGSMENSERVVCVINMSSVIWSYQKG